ncbi:hypothetical protein D3C81_1534410 [compost metagenome]
MNDTFYIPTVDIKSDDNPPLRIFPLDLIRSLYNFYTGQLGQWNLVSHGIRNQKVTDVSNIISVSGSKPYNHVEAFLTLEYQACSLPGKSRIDGSVYFINREMMLCNARAIIRYDNLRKPGNRFDVEILGSLDLFDYFTYFLSM